MISYSGLWEHFGVKDGLPDMRIECLCEDSEGTLWIGTRAKGVVRYRGDAFTWSTTRDGLGGDEVFAVVEARGQICVATNGGLSKWNGESFEAIKGSEDVSFLWGAAADTSGNVWFGAERTPDNPARVFRWDGHRLTRRDLPGDKTSGGKSIHAVAVDGDGNVWCGGHGLFVLDAENRETRVLQGDDFNEVSSICAQGERVYVGTQAGLHVFENGEERPLLDVRTPVESLYCGPGGSVWIGQRDGKISRVGQDGNLKDVGSVDVPIWRGLLEDDHNRVWVGSYGFGLFCYDENSAQQANLNSGLPADEVQAVVVHDNEVWLGTVAGLITASGKDLSAFCAPSKIYLKKPNVTGLVADKGGRLWIGKRNGMTYVLADGEIVACEPVPSMIGYRIDTLVEDAEGAIWIASSSGGGIAKYSSPTEVEVFEGAFPESYPGRVGAIAASRGGAVAIGSRSPRSYNGVTEYSDGAFAAVDGVGGSPISALCYDKTGRLWVGTSEGVSICDGDFLLSFGLEDGLPSELVTTLFEDSSGRMWIGTEGGGVCVYDGKVFQTFQFSGNHHCNTVRAVAEDESGAIWLGTNGGVVRRTLYKSEVEVSVTGVAADAEYSDPTEVQFPDTVGRITIGFSGRSPSDRTSNLVYRYRLGGYDDEWLQTRDREVDYPKLGPGQYDFQVEATDRNLNHSSVAKVAMTVVADPRIDALTRALRTDRSRSDFVGESHAMREVLRQIREVAWTDLSVLVLGETGTGKGLAAAQIHEQSERNSGPFIHVNCGAVQENLIDSELFGHEKGAFTGASSRRLGKFELADGGTIFLDEIGDLPVESQARLLKVLQEKTMERLGGTQTLHVDVRVIAATNRDLARAVRDNEYRADLYYRLNVFPIVMPPLRERKEDTEDLARHFVQEFAAHLNKPPPKLTDEARSALVAYDWPGNVRELEHTVQRAVILAQNGEITAEQLGLDHQSATVGRSDDSQMIVPLVEFERRYFERVLRHTSGVIHGDSGAAKLLAMKPTTLRSRLEKLGIRTRKKRAE